MQFILYNKNNYNFIDFKVLLFLPEFIKMLLFHHVINIKIITFFFCPIFGIQCVFYP